MADANSFKSDLAKAKDSFARWHVIRNAGDTRDKFAVDGLLGVLELPAPDLGGTDERAIAAWALGRLGLDVFVDRIPSSGNAVGKSSLHRAGIVDALGETRDRRANNLLTSILRAEDDREVWLNGTLALSKMGEPALECLVDLSASAAFEQRLMVLDAIHKIGGDSGKANFARVSSLLSETELDQAGDFLSKYA